MAAARANSDMASENQSASSAVEAKPKPKPKPKPKAKPTLERKEVPRARGEVGIVKKNFDRTTTSLVQRIGETQKREISEDSGANIKDVAKPSIVTENASAKESRPVTMTVTPPSSEAMRLHNPTPDYPRTSRRLGEEGTVIVRLLVRADGSVAELSIKQSSSHPRLDRSAIKTLKHWRYQPARKNGQAVDYWYEQSIVFSLRR